MKTETKWRFAVILIAACGAVYLSSFIKRNRRDAAQRVTMSNSLYRLELDQIVLSNTAEILAASLTNYITNHYTNDALVKRYEALPKIHTATNPPAIYNSDGERVLDVPLYQPGDYMLGDTTSISNAATLGPPPRWKILCADNPYGKRLYVPQSPGGQMFDVMDSPMVRTSYAEAVVVAWRIDQSMHRPDEVRRYNYLWKECQ